MRNITVNIPTVLFLGIICLTSSLPVGDETKNFLTSTIPSTVSLNKVEDKAVNGAGNPVVAESSGDNKNEVDTKGGKDEDLKKEIIDGTPVKVSETLVPVNTNGSKDVYVIKTIVYEVGILTEADDSTLNDTESHEEVNLTFFDPKRNESTIDLTNIPVPIQTNISGVSITGLAPANFGTIQLPEGDKPATLTPNFPLAVPLLPNAVISVKHNISTTNTDKETQLLGNLPNLLGLTSPITGELLKIETASSANTEELKKESDKKEPLKNSDSSGENSEHQI